METGMKVKIKEEPAWRRILDIEVEASVVDRELDKVVEEYRRRLALPGFRKGKVPAGLARKHMGDDLQSEVLRRILPQAFEDAVRESELRPIGDPHLSNLQFNPGQPLTFTATIEVFPQVEVKGYEGLALTRNQPVVDDEKLKGIFDHLREQQADLEEVDRPAQGGDVLTIRFRELGEDADPDKEPEEMQLTLGQPQTPESFNRELMGTVVGDMKEIPLEYPPDYPEESLAGKTRKFHVTVGKIEEKIWPPLDDAFAKKVMNSEEAGLSDLESRIRLNLEAEARMESMKEMENNLIRTLLDQNPFDVPQGIVESTLDRIVEEAKEGGRTITPDEEVRVKEQYRPGVENRYRADILLEAVGKQEKIEVSDEDLAKEIEAFAEQEGKQPAQIRAQLKREGNLERLRNDLFRRRVIDKLVEKADITVVKKQEGEENA